MLQQTVDRAKEIIPINNILILTSKEERGLVSRAVPRVPKKNIIAEPVSRNTAPAVCLGASIVKKRDPDGIIFVMPADHIIEDKIKDIFSFASLIVGMKDCLLTIGIKPASPATGYGYIKCRRLYKRLLADKKMECYKVDRFIEKPTLPRAKTFVRSKRYLWNSGIFIGRAQTFLDEFKRYKPAIYRIAEKIDKGLGKKNQQGLIDRYYKKFPGISIDYAIMEKTEKAFCVKADISWLDIGSWKGLEGYLKKGPAGNIIMGDFLGVDVKDSIILGEKNHLIACLGLDNIVVVQTKDATLVCAKDKAEGVRALVELAENKAALRRYL